ncbi:MAG: rRNA maturation RNase YbeY [Oscillospiraceae bacterium]|nr:rRNA maturation RNase YbeY [Oscillospiraceae bacterium]
MTDHAINIRGPAKYKKYIKKAVLAALEYEKTDYECEINVEVTDDRKIQKLNKQYRQKDCPTDVLSFSMNEINPENGKTQLGDIVISVETARKQSEEFETGLEGELMFLAAHAALHLLGYDHEISEEDDFVMREKQKEIAKIYE